MKLSDKILSGILRNKRPTGRISGIYFLLRKGQIVYVGQSVNIHSRVHSHFSDKDFDAYSFIESEGNLDDLELFYIKLLTPKFNSYTRQRYFRDKNMETGFMQVATELSNERKKTKLHRQVPSYVLPSHLERIIKESGGIMPDRARDIIAEAKRGNNAKG